MSIQSDLGLSDGWKPCARCMAAEGLCEGCWHNKRVIHELEARPFHRTRDKMSMGVAMVCLVLVALLGYGSLAASTTITRLKGELRKQAAIKEGMYRLLGHQEQQTVRCEERRRQTVANLETVRRQLHSIMASETDQLVADTAVVWTVDAVSIGTTAGWGDTETGAAPTPVKE